MMIKTGRLFAVVSLVFLLLVSCTGDNDTDANDVEKQMLRILGKSTDEEVLDYFCHDYDGSGQPAMYALTEEQGSQNPNCRLWFVTPEDATLVDDAYKSYALDRSFAIQVDQLVFLKLEQMDGDNPTSRLWGLRDGKPYSPAISGKGCWMYKSERGDFVLLQDERTRVSYHYFWDGEEFREYGGISIALEALNRLEGADKILEENVYSKENAEIQDVIYRENQLIHVNYTYGDRKEPVSASVTLRCIDGSAALSSREEGIYLAAFLPDLAAYPSDVGFIARREIDTREVVEELTKNSRFVGTEENRLAGEFIIERYLDIGLEPVDGASFKWEYRQEVSGRNLDLFNVVGIIPGSDRTKATVITSHFDSEKNTPGAVDNASGVASMLRVAWIIASREEAPPCDVLICSFNGEEQFYQGSLAIVDALIGSYESVENINLDCVGMVDGGHYMLGCNPGEVSADLVSAFQRVVYDNRIPYSIVLNSAVRSDHKAFLSRGKPAVTLTQFNLYKIAHTPNDTIDLLDFEALDLISDLTARVALERQAAKAQLSEASKTQPRESI